MNVKKIKHREQSEATKKQILAASGNQCAFPTYDRIIVDREHNVIVGKIGMGSEWGHYVASLVML